jgi:hypothetical protein
MAAEGCANILTLIESEWKLLQETTSFFLSGKDVSSLKIDNNHEQSKAPKRKEEYVSSDEIKEFHDEILEAGTHLASMSSVGFPDAESVSNTIAHVLSVVKQYKLVGRWIISRVSNTEKEYVTTNKIFHVSFLRVFFINQFNARSLTIGFSSDYSAGRYRLRGKVKQVF